MIAAAAHHAHRPGLAILALIVVAALVYGLVRLANRRQRHRGHPEQPLSGEPTAAKADPVASPDRASSQPAASPGQPEQPPPPPPRRARPVAASATQGDSWAVETHGLTKRFGTNLAVDDVNLLVPRGCAFGYLGPNGAGKTTLIRTLLGLTAADSGTMSLLGIPVPAERRRALARVGAIVDEPRFHGHLTATENLSILAAARDSEAKSRIEPSLRRVGLSARAGDKVAEYSMGMRQRLGVAACLLGDPELLILDEPMNGLDPAGMHEMRSMIEGLVDEGRTVMLSSHLLDEVERTCDAVAIVDRGRVIRQGSIDELVRGANMVVNVVCSDPHAAAAIVEGLAAGTTVASGHDGLAVTLPAGSSRELIAELTRRLVQGGISIYGIQEQRTTLETWFLSVTSRLGQES